MSENQVKITLAKGTKLKLNALPIELAIDTEILIDPGNINILELVDVNDVYFMPEKEN